MPAGMKRKLALATVKRRSGIGGVPGEIRREGTIPDLERRMICGHPGGLQELHSFVRNTQTVFPAN